MHFQPAHRLNELRHRAAEPVELPNRQRLAGADMTEHLRQPRTIGLGARSVVLAADGAQCVELECEALLGGRYPWATDRQADLARVAPKAGYAEALAHLIGLVVTCLLKVTLRNLLNINGVFDNPWDCRRIGGQAAPLGGSPSREWPES